jgi:putative transposase
LPASGLSARLIVRWGISERNERHLVIAALDMACFPRRAPRDPNHPGDRNVVYCSGDFNRLLQQYDMDCSTSRKGDCHANPSMQS